MLAQGNEPLSDLEMLRSMLLKFLEQPLHNIAGLKMEMIPESTGIYAIYENSKGDVQPRIIYIGIVTEISARPRVSTGLRFRICEKHCGTRGEDDFRSGLKELRRLDSFEDTQEYLRSNCSCRWLEEDDPGLLRRLEHFAIALLNPPFNA